MYTYDCNHLACIDTKGQASINFELYIFFTISSLYSCSCELLDRTIAMNKQHGTNLPLFKFNFLCNVIDARWQKQLCHRLEKKVNKANTSIYAIDR